MTQFGERGVVTLKAQLSRCLPKGITAEVEVYYKVANPIFGDWHCKTPQEAIAVKAKCDEAYKVFNMLPQAIDKGSRFANGGGYVQHPPKAVEAFIAAVRELIVKYYNPTKSEVSKSRVLREFDTKPQLPGLLKVLYGHDSILGRVYERLCCIDEQGREWGQAGYALKSDPHWNMRVEKEWRKFA